MSKEKRRYLKQSKNLKSRRYFIETDYIDGVYDDEGNQIMRALTEEEKDFLNKFYKETVNAAPEELYTDVEEKREIYRDNNARNRDLYNIAQRTGKLVIAAPFSLQGYSSENIYEYALKHCYTNNNESVDKSLPEEGVDSVNDRDEGTDES